MDHLLLVGIAKTSVFYFYVDIYVVNSTIKIYKNLGAIR